MSSNVKKNISYEANQDCISINHFFCEWCNFSPTDSFEEHFPKNENLLEFKSNLIEPPERQDYDVYGLETKYDGDTINVKFKLNNGISEAKGAIGFDGDTLKLFYRLWCKPCATEWVGFELNYKILNKSRMKFRVLPVFVTTEDLDKM